MAEKSSSYFFGGMMEGQKSFKERVKETLISYAQDYKMYYVDYEYLLCSNAFSRSAYYIVSAHEENYLHLTGVHTNLGASAFFQKCYDGTLEENDFDFNKDGELDTMERTLDFMTFNKMMNNSGDSSYDVDDDLVDEIESSGLDYDELPFMDEDERIEALEELNLPPKSSPSHK